MDSVESADGREAIEEFWEKAVESKCEGLMIKAGDRKINLFPAVYGVPQLLDNTEVIAKDEEDLIDGSEDPQLNWKALEGVTAPKTRRKALPATYEPGGRPLADNVSFTNPAC